MRALRFLFLFAALLSISACGGFPTEPSDFEYGRADVYVRDMDGQPINGVRVRLDRRNGNLEDEGGLTGSAGLPGYYFFLHTTGEYRIVIVVPPGYALGADQSAAVDIQFVKGRTTVTTFVLRRL